MGFWTIKLKPAVFCLIIFIAAAAASGFLLSGNSLTTAGKDRVLPIYNVERTDKKMAISFDAAWGNVILRH